MMGPPPEVCKSVHEQRIRLELLNWPFEFTSTTYHKTPRCPQQSVQMHAGGKFWSLLTEVPRLSLAKQMGQRNMKTITALIQ